MLKRLRALRSNLGAHLTLLALPLLAASLFADGGAGGDEGTAGVGNAGDQGGSSDAGANGGADGGGDSFKAITSQDELDRRIGSRLAREREKFADYEALKEKASKLDELEAANQSELEKAQAAAATAQRERDEARLHLVESAIRATVVAVAAKHNAADPDDIVALLPKNAVTLGDDGQVTGAEEAVKALLAAKPHLVGKTTTTSGSADGGARGNATAKPNTLEDAVQARLSGAAN